MHLGLIGGIGPAATDYYYRRLIALCAASGTTLELTIGHADSPTLLANLAKGDKASQVEIFLKLANRLKAAGADTVAVTAIAGHFCIEELGAVSPLPVADLLKETNAAIGAMGLDKVGILGTATAMETRMYGQIDTAEVIPPAGPELTQVHESYINMVGAGKATDADRDIFVTASRRLIEDHGAQAIMLAGTDLVLVFDGTDYGFEVIDCAGIHVNALAKIAAS